MSPPLPSVSAQTPTAPRDGARLEAARPKADAQLDKVAQDFEAIFVRKVLGDLQKTTKLSGEKKQPGADLYEGIWLTEVSSSLARSGGFGLARMMKETLARQGKSPEEALSELHGALRHSERESAESQARGAQVSAPGAVPSLHEDFRHGK